jgi:site-specific DNA recombinase
MDAYRFGGNRICDNKQVRTSVLEEAVWEDVSDLLRDPERIQKEYQRRLRDDDESCLALKQNEGTINKMQRAIARLIDAYEDDLITKECSSCALPIWVRLQPLIYMEGFQG